MRTLLRFCIAITAVVFASPSFAAEPVAFLKNAGDYQWCGTETIVYIAQDGIYQRNVVTGKTKQIIPIFPNPHLDKIFYADIQDCSPDGKWLAYRGYNIRQRSQQFIYNLETGRNEKIGLGAYDLKWSPDGKKIFYYEIYIIEGDEQLDKDKLYFSVPKDLPWQAVKADFNPDTLPNSKWLADSSAVTYNDAENDYAVRELNVLENRFVLGKFISKEEGYRKVIQVTADNEVILGSYDRKAGQQVDQINFLICKKSDDWKCEWAAVHNYYGKHYFIANTGEFFFYNVSQENGEYEISVRGRDAKDAVFRAKAKRLESIAFSPEEKYMAVSFTHEIGKFSLYIFKTP